MARTVDNFFEGGGAPACKFPTIGTSVTGTVVGELEMRQRNDIITGEPMAWSDGNPKMQLIIQLQTDDRDADLADDDGVRRLFVPDPGGLKAAIGKALHEADAKRIEQGGILTVMFISETPAKTKGLNPAKNYQASYTKPNASGTFFNGNGSAATDLDLPKGMTPEVWAGLTPELQASLREVSAKA
jgi:hypothetical protein